MPLEQKICINIIYVEWRIRDRVFLLCMQRVDTNSHVKTRPRKARPPFHLRHHMMPMEARPP